MKSFLILLLSFFYCSLVFTQNKVDGVVFNGIDFFPGGYDCPPESQRYFQTEFPKSSTRYIWFNLSLINEYFLERDETYTISWMIFRSDGSLFKETSASVTFKSDWPTMYYPQGVGWVDPGKWVGDTYTGKVFVNGYFMGEKDLILYNDFPQVQFQGVEFFEAGDIAPPESSRIYATSFPQNAVSSIWFEISLSNNYYLEEDQYIKFKGKYYYPDGTHMVNADFLYKIPEEYDYYNVWNGYGWSDPGNWQMGTYRFELFIGNKLVSENYFNIY